MASLIDIKKRIQSVKKTKKITQALKMVSAAKLRKAEIKLKKARPYALRLNNMVSDVLARTQDKEHPFFVRNEMAENTLLVVVSADRGLCGSFNGSILRRTNDFLEEKKWKNVDLVCIGNKACNYYKKRDIKILEEYRQIVDKTDYADAEKIADLLADIYIAGNYQTINIVYNEFKSVISQNLKFEQVLPVSGLEEGKKSKEMSEFIYEPSQSVVIDKILRQYLDFKIYKILCESNTSEQGARMTAMESATDNADEVIRSMTLMYNRVRQANITRELAEIVSGAEALSA